MSVYESTAASVTHQSSGPNSWEDMLDSPLPDSDHIPGIIRAAGIYDVRRWPEKLTDVCRFVEQLRSKWGNNAFFVIVDPHDGYPGYIQVTRK